MKYYKKLNRSLRKTQILLKLMVLLWNINQEHILTTFTKNLEMLLLTELYLNYIWKCQETIELITQLSRLWELLLWIKLKTWKDPNLYNSEFLYIYLKNESIKFPMLKTVKRAS